MKLVRANYEILSRLNGNEMVQNIERYGRTCYKSEGKITDDSAEGFIKMLIKRGHESVLEHETISVRFICDRGVSHEIVRHRLASFSQESTRYCNYSTDKFDNQVTFIIPEWINMNPGVVYQSDLEHLTHVMSTLGDYQDAIFWIEAMLQAERYYNLLIGRKWQPQQARSVLPNSLKTEIVVTANLREWRTIFKQRTSQFAHPQMRELMCPLLNNLSELLHAVFDDITY